MEDNNFHARRGSNNVRHTDYSSNTQYKEKPNIGEKRMLRISFD